LRWWRWISSRYLWAFKWEAAYCREINIQFSGNSSGGHSCSQHAKCTHPQNLCDQTAHFRVPFYCPQRKVHLCNDQAL
jgi:hypothetical protein